MQATPSPPHCNIANDFNVEVIKAKAIHNSKQCPAVAFWPISCILDKHQDRSRRILGESQQLRNCPGLGLQDPKCFFEELPYGWYMLRTNYNNKGHSIICVLVRQVSYVHAVT